MGKLVRQLKIAIDLRALADKNIDEDTKDLLKCGAWKGSLGTTTVLSEAFDIYLLVPKSKIIEAEILRWLKAAQIDVSFRKFFSIDENIRDTILSETINVTITSCKDLAEKLKDVTKVYYIQKKEDKDIRDGIFFVTQWREIIRDISFFSTE